MCCGVIKHPGANLQGNKRESGGEEDIDPCERAQALWGGGCWQAGLAERGCSILSPHQSPREDVVMGADLLSAPFQRSEMTNSSLGPVLKAASFKHEASISPQKQEYPHTPAPGGKEGQSPPFYRDTSTWIVLVVSFGVRWH